MMNRLYDAIRKNKTLTGGLVGVSLGLGGLLHSTSYLGTPIPSRVERIYILERVLETNPFENLTLNDLLSQNVNERLENDKILARQKRDELDYLNTVAGQERIDYEGNKEYRTKRGNTQLACSILVALASAVPFGIGVGMYDRRRISKRGGNKK